MGNLIKMDLYRLNKAKSFRVCLLIAAVFALINTPFYVLLDTLARVFSTDAENIAKTADLAKIIGNPFPFVNTMLALLAACSFFYADVENGYIKNIAGQMPKKGYTVLSKFLAAIPMNLAFMIVGVVFNLIGTVLFQKIVAEGDIFKAIGTFFVRFLLIQSLCAVMLLVVSGLANKSLGTVVAVLMGLGLMSLIYLAIDSGLDQVFKNKGFSIVDYMPDQLLEASNLKLVRGIVVAIVTGAIFLPLTIRIIDKKDVK